LTSKTNDGAAAQPQFSVTATVAAGAKP